MSKLHILVIGGGGREHAIADAFTRSPKVDRVTVAPGNDGIALQHDTITLSTDQDVLQFCLKQKVDMVFIGPEQPIEQGLSDFLRKEGIGCIGASKAAGRIETSKGFAKDLMSKYQIPTASYVIACEYEQALNALGLFSYPLVIKADGLAAGKGVFVVQSSEVAQEVLSKLFFDNFLGISGQRVVIEEYMEGWEVSLFIVTDGANFTSTVFSQDHKQLLDGDNGPNTGGMGAYAPVHEAEAYRDEINDNIVIPILKAMRAEGCHFEGILYCGLMITDQGAKVVEFNCRLGDPETQAVFPLLKTDLVDVCQAILTGRVDKLRLEWDQGCCICVVLASQGYPNQHVTGLRIFIDEPLESKIYYAGVRKIDESLATNGGRVLNLVAQGPDLETARYTVYNEIESKVKFDGMTFRRDIGNRCNTLIRTRTK